MENQEVNLEGSRHRACGLILFELSGEYKQRKLDENSYNERLIENRIEEVENNSLKAENITIKLKIHSSKWLNSKLK
jgi:hypothetical protein